MLRKNCENYVLCEGLSDSDLVELRAETNFNWPFEFVELYRFHNGIGIIDHSQNRVDWLLIPSSQITSFSATMRGWFSKTHSSIAANFFPFINFEYSDAIGYLMIDGKLADSLYQFNHEEYCHRSDQSWGEFLTPLNLKLQEWFTLVAEMEAKFYPSSKITSSDNRFITPKEIPSLPGQENIDEFL